MILKPNDAAQKRCPFSKQQIRRPEDGIGCLINDCMAWKWYHPPHQSTIIGDVDSGLGFCGLLMGGRNE